MAVQRPASATIVQNQVDKEITAWLKPYKMLFNTKFQSLSFTLVGMDTNFWTDLTSAVIQIKQSNPKCQVWPLLPCSNRVGLDKKLSNSPKMVSIELGTWPMSNEA